MTVTPTVPLHPSLQKLGAVHRRRLRLLGLLLFLTLAGTLLFEMVIAFTSQDGASLLLLGLIGVMMLPLVALMGGLTWYLDRKLSRSLNAANQLLRDCAPLAARLTPTGLTLRTGVLATLEVPGAEPGREGPWHVLLNPSFRWSPSPRREVAVQVYCTGFAPDADLVALQPDGAPLLGKVVALDAFQRQLRWVRIAQILLLVLLLGVLGVLVGRS